jgi:hypothetical protein
MKRAKQTYTKHVNKDNVLDCEKVEFLMTAVRWIDHDCNAVGLLIFSLTPLSEETTFNPQNTHFVESPPREG